ncbi:intercompartmental signaling factor BofC [Bacillus solimangrovi]|uniref:Regulator n=1 Tax=Bacillus solimangrovi TaxID=1305675 RepID=A0A1E5LBM0_9BACI|nr:intercompartmental signaling factor BofC [Bacillus solimangrovi]OEH91482.1 regulator [Bacillus solimangrovi]
MTVRISKLQAMMILLIGAISGALTMFAFFSSSFEVKAKPEEESTHTITEPITVEVTLQKHYVDGKLSEDKLTEIIWAMEDFWSTYSDWQLVHQEKGQVIFRKQIDDISPLLKQQGYFGLSEEGRLTIYSGKPELDDVIQSFFQINIEKLEVHQQEELKQGIPIKSKEQYEDVIETFRMFKIDAVPF